MITDEQIIEASKQFKSGAEVARFLGMHVSRYRVRAKRLGCCVVAPKQGRVVRDKIYNSIELIESGEIKNRDEVVIRRHIKRYLIHKHGHKCQICENTEWMGKPIPLICDHIDGDSTNSDISNFRNICANCDAQTDTFKSKNRGKGRKYDRERYVKRS